MLGAAGLSLSRISHAMEPARGHKQHGPCQPHRLGKRRHWQSGGAHALLRAGDVDQLDHRTLALGRSRKPGGRIRDAVPGFRRGVCRRVTLEHLCGSIRGAAEFRDTVELWWVDDLHKPYHCRKASRNLPEKFSLMPITPPSLDLNYLRKKPGKFKLCLPFGEFSGICSFGDFNPLCL